MKASIGELIRESVRKSGLTQEDFAKEMGMTLRNLANLFNKDRLPFEQLVRASRILKEDFVKAYTAILYDEEPGLHEFRRTNGDVASESHGQYEMTVHAPEEITFSLNIKGESTKIANEIGSLLSVIKAETEARGLHLG